MAFDIIATLLGPLQGVLGVLTPLLVGLGSLILLLPPPPLLLI
jgi:uncharacterized membrane protein YuzA (DUF378 family)